MLTVGWEFFSFSVLYIYICGIKKWLFTVYIHGTEEHWNIISYTLICCNPQQKCQNKHTDSHTKKNVNFATLNKIILDYRRCKNRFKNKIVDVINGKVYIDSFANLIIETKKRAISTEILPLHRSRLNAIGPANQLSRLINQNVYFYSSIP